MSGNTRNDRRVARAYAENSAFLYSIEFDPKREQLRSDARFARVQREGNAPTTP